MFCPKCGKELPDIAKFCGYCGHKLEKSGNGKQNSAKEKNLEKKFWKILVIAVLGCCVFFPILVCSNSFHILHDWQGATCTEPLICSKCGKTKGEALGHTWKEVTCTQPKTCSKCGEIEGESLGGHTWEEATCTQPKTCSKCGEIMGVALKHRWEKATCTQPKTCSKCGEIEGESLGGHTWEEATCTQPQTCKRCGERTGRELGHDWADATCMELKMCDRCHIDGCLGKHSMNSSTGICEICGKELRIALDTSNWNEYLEAEGWSYCWFYINGTSVKGKLPVYYHFENAVIEAEWEVVSGRRKGFDGEWYSIKYTQCFRAELDRNGNGDFGKNFNKSGEEMTRRRETKSVSGFVIIDEDEYEKRGIKERNDLYEF